MEKSEAHQAAAAGTSNGSIEDELKEHVNWVAYAAFEEVYKIVSKKPLGLREYIYLQGCLDSFAGQRTKFNTVDLGRVRRTFVERAKNRYRDLTEEQQTQKLRSDLLVVCINAVCGTNIAAAVRRRALPSDVFLAYTELQKTYRFVSPPLGPNQTLKRDDELWPMKKARLDDLTIDRVALAYPDYRALAVYLLGEKKSAGSGIEALLSHEVMYTLGRGHSPHGILGVIAKYNASKKTLGRRFNFTKFCGKYGVSRSSAVSDFVRFLEGAKIDVQAFEGAATNLRARLSKDRSLNELFERFSDDGTLRQELKSDP